MHLVINHPVSNVSVQLLTHGVGVACVHSENLFIVSGVDVHFSKGCE